MTAPTPVMPTREEVAVEVKRVTHAWSGPAMDEFPNDPPTRKQLAIADAVLAKASDALAAVAADRDDARRELAEQKRINGSNMRVMTEQLELARQKIAEAPHAQDCGYWWDKGMLGRPEQPCDCWKAGL